MTTADDLRASAQRFHELARVAFNPATKLQLICLGDDYFRQADEIKREQISQRQSEVILPQA
jgi:hypothetical protein